MCRQKIESCKIQFIAFTKYFYFTLSFASKIEYFRYVLNTSNFDFSQPRVFLYTSTDYVQRVPMCESNLTITVLVFWVRPVVEMFFICGICSLLLIFAKFSFSQSQRWKHIRLGPPTRTSWAQACSVWYLLPRFFELLSLFFVFTIGQNLGLITLE